MANVGDTAEITKPQAGHAWLGPSALVFIAVISLLLLVERPVWDVDIFWQLRLGELILARGGPVSAEPFAARHLGEHLPSLAWAGQALYAALREAGGWSLLRTVDALCWLGGFWAAAWAAHRRGAPALGLALALALGLIAALPQASVRPQSLAALCFGLLIALNLRPMRAPLRLGLAFILLVIWQNLHPSVAIAVVWLGARAGLGWLEVIRRRAGPLPWEESLLVALAALAMVLTPEGWGVFAVSATNAAASRAMGVSEWLALWHPVNRQVAVPILVVAGVVGWLVRRSGRFAADELLPALALLALTIMGYRFVLFCAIAIVPVIARAVPPRREARLHPLLRTVPLGVAIVLGLVLPTRFDPSLPLAAIARLREAGVQGTIYAHFPWGGPLIDVGWPQWHVAYDGRYYRYSQAQWQAYAAAGRGEVSLSSIETAWRPAAFLLDPGWNAPLIAALRASPGRWRELPGEGRAVAFVPAK